MEAARKKSLIEPLLITAAVLGVVQGLFWFLLCLGATFLYEGIFLPSANGIANMKTIGDYMFYTFLDKNEAYRDAFPKVKDINLIVRPKHFNIFMYIYVVLSFALLIVSSIILWASMAHKSKRFYKARIVWIINMALLSILDLVLMSLIAHDYGQISYTGETNASPILVAVGIVMTLAARGFVVWIINVIFIVILGKNWYNIYRKGVRSDQQILDAYGAGSRPPWAQANSLYADVSLGYNNKSFRDDNDNPMITSSSQSFSRLPINDRDRNKHKVIPNPFDNYENQNNHHNNWNKRGQNESELYPSGARGSPPRPADVPSNWVPQQLLRTAKIGRQGGQRSPPLNVNPPFIPDPDYSPPGSPRVRGVLRPKSNYVMY